VKIVATVTISVDVREYAKEKGIPLDEVPESVVSELEMQGDGLAWSVERSQLVVAKRRKRK
jgi:hypothetical protein